jgi:hypothetical protein
VSQCTWFQICFNFATLCINILILSSLLNGNIFILDLICFFICECLSFKVRLLLIQPVMLILLLNLAKGEVKDLVWCVVAKWILVLCQDIGCRNFMLSEGSYLAREEYGKCLIFLVTFV